MKPRAWIVALLLPVALPLTSAGAATPDWEGAFRGGSALTVAKLEWSKAPRVANRCPDQGDFRPLAQLTLRGSARRRLVDLLLAPERCTRGPDCGAYCLPCAEELAYEVDVEPDRAGVTALILFAERRVLFFQAEHVVGSRRLGDDAAAVLALINAAVRGAQDELPAARNADDGPAHDPRLCVFADRAPVATEKAKPEYPDLWKSAGAEGTVVIRALIGTDGRVRDAAVIQSIPILNEAARAAAMLWRFEPATCGGRPVAVWFDIPFTFKLH